MNLKQSTWDAWVAQLVKRPALDRGSGCDLVVHEIEPQVGLCPERGAFLGFSLSLSLSLCLSLKINTNLKIIK